LKASVYLLFNSRSVVKNANEVITCRFLMWTVDTVP